MCILEGSKVKLVVAEGTCALPLLVFPKFFNSDLFRSFQTPSKVDTIL